MKETKHYVFVDKKLDQDQELNKISLYGSLRELWRDNQDLINMSERSLQYRIKFDHYETEKFCIKRCVLQRSKRKN